MASLSSSVSNSPHSAASPRGVCSARRAVFCNGLMFGMVTDDTLYLRVDDHNQEVFREAASAPPLNYEKQGRSIDLAFWRTPDRLLDEPDELVTWARAALEAARRVAAKRRRRA
jgi:DNA transformation protein and related proteins